MTPAPPFNWLKALESAMEHGLTPHDRIFLSIRAAWWPTCACDTLCAGLPRNRNGSPQDKRLVLLGSRFYTQVFTGNWHAAIDLFHAIESRTAELLAEKAKQSP